MFGRNEPNTKKANLYARPHQLVEDTALPRVVELGSASDRSTRIGGLVKRTQRQNRRKPNECSQDSSVRP